MFITSGVGAKEMQTLTALSDHRDSELRRTAHLPSSMRSCYRADYLEHSATEPNLTKSKLRTSGSCNDEITELFSIVVSTSSQTMHYNIATEQIVCSVLFSLAGQPLLSTAFCVLGSIRLSQSNSRAPC